MEFDIFEEARVEAPNPYTGMVLWNKPDFYPKGFTEQELDKTYYGLVRDPDDYALMMESAPFEEVDGYYNPGTEEVDAAFITEAVVVKKFSRLEGVVRRGIVKAMNKYMTATDPDTGTPITAMDPIVGKPRKSGLFAYVTVQIPFSDGQVVSIVFHAPEGDQKKISPDDTVVAFRWLLNKRDITNAVAPEDGKEISLETVSKRVGQLVEKNTKRFAATQKEAQAEKKELADAQESIKGLQGQTDSLMVQIADSSKELETISAQIGTTAAALEKQKTINAELRAKLDALRKAQRPAPTGTGGDGTGTETSMEAEHPGVSSDVLSLLRDMKAVFTTNTLPFTWERGRNVIMNSVRSLLGEAKQGEYFHGIFYAKNELSGDRSFQQIEYNKKMDAYIVIPVSEEQYITIGAARGPYTDKYLERINSDNENTRKTGIEMAKSNADRPGLTYEQAMELLKKSESISINFDAPTQTGTPKPFGPVYYRNAAVSLDSLLSEFHVSSDEAKYFTSTLKMRGEDKVMKKDFETELDRLRNTRANGEDLYSLDDLLDMYNLDKMANSLKFSKTSIAKSYASFTKSQFALMAQEAGVQLPGTSGTETTNGEPVFAQNLNDILAGKYDNNVNPIQEMLELALDEAEKPGNEQYIELIDKASNYYTRLLAKRQGEAA